MVVSTQYKTYYGVYMYDVTFTWAGTEYWHQMLPEYMDEDIDHREYSAVNAPVQFIFSEDIKNTYYIDGMVQGHLRFHNADPSNDNTVTSYTVTLQKVNSSGSSADLGSQTNTVNETISSLDYETFPIFFQVQKKKVELGYRLRLQISAVVSDAAAIYLYHTGYKKYEDLKIEIPIILPRGS